MEKIVKKLYGRSSGTPVTTRQRQTPQTTARVRRGAALARSSTAIQKLRFGEMNRLSEASRPIYSKSSFYSRRSATGAFGIVRHLLEGRAVIGAGVGDSALSEGRSHRSRDADKRHGQHTRTNERHDTHDISPQNETTGIGASREKRCFFAPPKIIGENR